MWSDNDTLEDLLGFDQLVDTLEAVLGESHLMPLTVGVFSDWGGGKTSLMRMAEARLRTDTKLLTLWVSAWQFEGYADLRSALMRAVLERVQEAGGLKADGNKLLQKLFRRVDWLHAMGMAAKHAITLTPPSFEDLQKLLKPEDGDGTEDIRQFREDLETLLEGLDAPGLVVFVDDLDRCLPGHVVDTLEAIRLFLAVSKTAFVIGADERIIRYAIAQRYPASEIEAVNIGRDYLEKIVQLPVRIPPLTAAEAETYVNLLFAQHSVGPEELKRLSARARENRSRLVDVSLNHGVAVDVLGEISDKLADDFALAARIAGPLTRGLSGNPRQIKRFLNSLDLRLRLAERRGVALEAATLGKLMVLEYLHEEAFRELFGDVLAGNQPSLVDELESVAGDRATEARDDARVNRWMTQSDLVAWLRLEPPLSGKDLTPYLYFSRDRVLAPSATSRRLPPQLQELTARLASDATAVRLAAIETAKDLESIALGQLIDDLAEAVRRSPRPTAILDSLVALAAARAELLPRVSKVVADLPPAAVEPVVLFTIATRLKPLPADMVPAFERFARSSRKPLAAAARTALGRKP